MNLKALNLKWALAFAGAAVVGAVGVVLVLTLIGGGDEHATAQPDSATATPLATLPPGTVEGTVPPGATETPGTAVPTRPPAPSYPREIPTLPPDFTLTQERPCPDGWQRISDDVTKYSICIPQDWGILDWETGERAKELTRHDEDLHILSPDGFPHPVDEPLYEALQNRDVNLVAIQLGIATPGAGWPCDAKPRAALGSLPAIECQYRFDFLEYGDVEYRPDGEMVAIDIAVPLAIQSPPPEGAKSATWGLLIGIVGSEKAMEVHGDTVSQILDTLEIWR